MHFLLMMAKIMVGLLIFLVSLSEAYVNRLRPCGVLIYMEYSRKAMGGGHPIALRLRDLHQLLFVQRPYDDLTMPVGVCNPDRNVLMVR